MKTTVWDRIERVDVSTNLDSSEWEGDDAPTNAQPPAFVYTPKSGSGFWKGVVVGVGASAVLAGVTTVAGVVVVAAVYGLPALPVAPTASMAIQVEEPKVELVRAPVREIVVERPVRPPAVETAVVPVEPEPVALATVMATPAPVATRAPEPEPARPNRDELLELALAAKQSRAAAPEVTPVPAPKTVEPAPKWEDEPEETPQFAAAEEKWAPIDDTEADVAAIESR